MVYSVSDSGGDGDGVSLLLSSSSSKRSIELKYEDNEEQMCVVFIRGDVVSVVDGGDFGNDKHGNDSLLLFSCPTEFLVCLDDIVVAN
jgi:hypothetical protein